MSADSSLAKPERVANGFVARNLVLEKELRRVVQAFANERIDLVVLKGIPLALRLFGFIDSRVMVDNDLMVRSADARRSSELLRGLGYTSVDCRTVERQLDYDYQYRLWRPMPAGGAVNLELHWNAFPQDLYPVPESLLWDHTETTQVGELTCRVFDRPMTVVHLAAHFAQSEFGIPQILRDVARAWNLWYAHASQADVLALAAETRLQHALDFALSSAADLGMLEGPPPPIGSRRSRLLRALLPATRLSEERPKRDYQRQLLALLLVEPRRLLSWARHVVFPPVETIAAIEHRPKSRWLYLWYPGRPFRAFFRSVGLWPK